MAGKDTPAPAAVDTSNKKVQRQDVIVGDKETEPRHPGNVLLQDLVQLHAQLCKEQDPEAIAQRIVSLVKKGADYVLPSDVESQPPPFVDGKGRFVKKQGKDDWDEYQPVDDKEAIRFVSKLLQTEVQQVYTKETEEAPKRASKKSKNGKKKDTDEASPTKKTDKEQFVPAMDDIVLLKRGETTVVSPINRTGTSHLVAEIMRYLSKKKLWIKATSVQGRPRAEAALYIADKLREASVRVLAQSQDSAKLMLLQEIDKVDAAEFILLLLFDSILQREDELSEGHDLLDVDIHNYPAEQFAAPSTSPIQEPSAHDVLFGRGGLTNNHPGNRRFRDVISLHRPDYVRAIKVEKPNVAKRIVRAIRCGTPPGRFLKRDKDGLWYDVGDKHAAEKTSQALREKPPHEKPPTAADTKKRSSSSNEMEASKKLKLDAAAVAASVPLVPLAELAPIPTSPGEVKVPPISNYSGIATTVKANKPSKNKKKSKSTKDDEEEEDEAPFVAKASAAGTAETVDAEGNVLVTVNDILCGRGGLTNHHIGNKRFRDIITLHRPDYVRAPKIQKPAVARLIVKAIRNSDPPGRFLKRDPKTDQWYDIGDKRAAEKASQALREKSKEERDQAKEDQGGRPFPLSLYTNPQLYKETAAALRTLMPGAPVETKDKDKTAAEGEDDKTTPKGEEPTSPGPDKVEV